MTSRTPSGIRTDHVERPDTFSSVNSPDCTRSRMTSVTNNGLPSVCRCTVADSSAGAVKPAAISMNREMSCSVRPRRSTRS